MLFNEITDVLYLDGKYNNIYSSLKEKIEKIDIKLGSWFSTWIHQSYLKIWPLKIKIQVSNIIDKT